MQQNANIKKLWQLLHVSLQSLATESCHSTTQKAEPPFYSISLWGTYAAEEKRALLGKQPLIQVVSGGVWWFFSLILAVLGSKNSCISFRKELTRDAKTQMRLQSSWPYGLNLQDSRNFVDLCLAHFTVREDWDLFKICSKFLTTGCTDLEIKFCLPTALPCHSKFRWAS